MRRYKAGKPLSALDGVPFAVKDLMDALPCPTGSGTVFMASQCVARRPQLPVTCSRSDEACLLSAKSTTDHNRSVTYTATAARHTVLHTVRRAAPSSMKQWEVVP